LNVKIVTEHLAWDIRVPDHASTVTIQADEKLRLYACFQLSKIWTDGYNIIDPKPSFQWYYDGKKLAYGYWSSLEIFGPDSTDVYGGDIIIEDGKKIKVVIDWGDQTGSAETIIKIEQCNDPRPIPQNPSR
jgi:hypothetical protein